jgi:hypothetical protein
MMLLTRSLKFPAVAAGPVMNLPRFYALVSISYAAQESGTRPGQ